MKPTCLAIALIAILPLGCANLNVTKVPVDHRASGADANVPGFRYYLSRPYVTVARPVAVSQVRTLVNLDAKTNKVTFLEGERKGQTVCLEDVKVLNTGSGALEPVSPGDLAALKRIAAPVAKGGRPQNSGVVAAGHEEPSEFGVIQADTVPSGVGTPLSIPEVSTKQSSASLQGAVQIVFLPDMDEQYAIESKNALAKTAFGLNFKDGWALSNVAGEHDSTTLSIELFNLLDNAVNQAKDLAVLRLQQKGDAAEKDVVQRKTTQDPKAIYYLTETTYLKPGLYRLNKPWESDGLGHAPQGCSLLVKLGLPTIVCTSVEPAAGTP